MSLFEDASLAMIPSAVKDGKLYSIKPSDGSGDFTFSRGSNLAATRVDVNGLIEKGRENTTTYSQDSSQWSDVKLGIVGSSNTDPFNGSSAVEYEVTSITGAAYFYRTTSPSVSSGQVVTGSVYIKNVDQRYIQLLLGSAAFGNGHYQNFDLQTGTKGTSANIIDSSIESVGNGWYRLSITKQATASGSSGLVCGFVPSASATRLQAPSTLGLSLQAFGFQTELGLVATDYIETGSSTAQAGILEDLPRLDYSGSCPALLLEPQRSNLVSHSEYINSPHYGKSSGITLTNNYGDSPEGVENSTRVQSTDSNQYLLESFTLSANKTYIFSCYVKGTSGEKVRQYVDGNGAGVIYDDITLDGTWQRNELTISTDSDGGSVNLHLLFGYGLTNPARDIETWGWQLEEGSYPTSYIPTYGSSVTRNADFSSDDDLVDTPIAFGANDEFTLFYEGSFNDLSSSRNMIMGGGKAGLGASYKNYWWVENATQMRISGEGEVLMARTTISIADNTNVKLLVKRSGSVIDFFLNGSKLTTTQHNTNTAFTFRSLGWSYTNSYYKVSGIIKQSVIFQTALTDSECIALTTL